MKNNQWTEKKKRKRQKKKRRREIKQNDAVSSKVVHIKSTAMIRKAIRMSRPLP